MTPEQVTRMKELCQLVQTETDLHLFSKQVLELAVLLQLKGNDLGRARNMAPVGQLGGS